MEYNIIRKKIRNAYIQVKDDSVFIRVPLKMSDKEISKIIAEKKCWIEKQINMQKVKANEEKSGIMLLGKKYPIVVNKSQSDHIEITEKSVDIYTPDASEENINRLINDLYKKCAQNQFIKSTQKMMNITNLEPNLWRIRDINYAWGSCSSKKTITLSLKLIKKREELIEYVILHELCHLKYMNHSKQFWELVEKYMPHYKLFRKELKS